MKQLFGTYRKKSFSAPVDTGSGITLNGNYTPSFVLDSQFADYKAAGLTKIIDSLIPEDRYTGEIVPGVNKLTRLIIGEYNETYVNGSDFMANVAKVGAEFNIEVFPDAITAKEWIRSNTNLIERSEGVFVVREESIGIGGEVVTEELLIVE